MSGQKETGVSHEPTTDGGDFEAVSEFATVDRLPDTLLIEIFVKLTPRDLVHSVSPVCRRWQRVVWDKELWQQVDVNWNCRLLRKAGAARTLIVSHQEDIDMILSQTEPKLELYRLNFYHYGRIDPSSMIALLEYFNGRLHSLDLIGVLDNSVLSCIDGMQGLKLLSIAPYECPLFEFKGRGLETIVVHNTCIDMARSLLSAHKSTVTGFSFRFSEPFGREGMEDLARCEKLEWARIHYDQNLNCLEGLTRVRYLKLCFYDLDDEHAAATVSFVRNSALMGRITMLKLYWWIMAPMHLEAIVKGCHSVRVLIMTSYQTLPSNTLDPLKDMSSLEQLYLRNMDVPEAWLDAIACIPNLRLLCIDYGPSRSAFDRLRQKRPELLINESCWHKETDIQEDGNSAGEAT